LRRGSWVLCTDAYFGGRCRVFGPGHYATVGMVLNDQISSARPLSQ
jgi:hypothetical protein